MPCSENQEVPKACGTTQYMAPELLQKKNRSRHGLPVDWWAAGCIMFEIMTGYVLHRAQGLHTSHSHVGDAWYQQRAIR